MLESRSLQKWPDMSRIKIVKNNSLNQNINFQQSNNSETCQDTEVCKSIGLWHKGMRIFAACLQLFVAIAPILLEAHGGHDLVVGLPDEPVETHHSSKSNPAFKYQEITSRTQAYKVEISATGRDEIQVRVEQGKKQEQFIYSPSKTRAITWHQNSKNVKEKDRLVQHIEAQKRPLPELKTYEKSLHFELPGVGQIIINSGGLVSVIGYDEAEKATASLSLQFKEREKVQFQNHTTRFGSLFYGGGYLNALSTNVANVSFCGGSVLGSLTHHYQGGVAGDFGHLTLFGSDATAQKLASTLSVGELHIKNVHTHINGLIQAGTFRVEDPTQTSLTIAEDAMMDIENATASLLRLENQGRLHIASGSFQAQFVQNTKKLLTYARFQTDVLQNSGSFVQEDDALQALKLTNTARIYAKHALITRTGTNSGEMRLDGYLLSLDETGALYTGASGATFENEGVLTCLEQHFGYGFKNTGEMQTLGDLFDDHFIALAQNQGRWRHFGRFNPNLELAGRKTITRTLSGLVELHGRQFLPSSGTILKPEGHLKIVGQKILEDLAVTHPAPKDNLTTRILASTSTFSSEHAQIPYLLEIQDRLDLIGDQYIAGIENHGAFVYTGKFESSQLDNKGEAIVEGDLKAKRVDNSKNLLVKSGDLTVQELHSSGTTTIDGSVIGHSVENDAHLNVTKDTQVTRELRSLLEQGKIDKGMFTTKELQSIESGKAKIGELTWHHHQQSGRMQLVPYDYHRNFPHTGSIGLKKNIITK